MTFPLEELQVIDMTVRMFTEPKLLGDIDVFAKVWSFEQERKAQLLEDLGVASSDLQSADKFAALLQAEGIAPERKAGKNGEIYAFAKTDQFMVDLLENDDERIRTLAEARLGLKSTLDQTRAERLGFMATRGPMPVYLQYCGAHTTRWSGGDKLNWQNLKRGSALRKGCRAPAGHRIVKADKSQIECRILNYVAGQWDVIEKFAAGVDPYVGIASQFYGRAITKADPAERGVGKQLELSCLGPDTLVLTNNGAKSITKVNVDDWLWDGIEWVQHRGLVHQGMKYVIPLVNLWVTPEHLVLCGSSWLEAAKLQNVNTLSLALASGSAKLPYPATKWDAVGGSLPSWCSAHAALRSTPLIPTTLSVAALRDVMLALKKRLDTGLKNTTAMRILFLMTPIGAAYSIESELFCSGAPAMGTKTMERVAFACMDLGPKAQRDGAISCVTSWGSLAGMTLRSTWIARTTARAISRAICSLLPTNRTVETDEPWPRCKKKMMTYDLRCAGPRNRFTVLSSAGPLIVHNCGYGAGADTIVRTAIRGTYGPPVQLTAAEGLAARDLYRSTHPGVVDYWRQAGRIISALAGTETAVSWGPLTVETGRISLQGIPIWYPELNYYRAEDGDEFWRYKTRKGWAKLYGGKLVENVVQFMSRVDMSQSLLRILARTGIRPVQLEHDAAVWAVPDNLVDPFVKVVNDEMTRAPEWLPGIPLAAETTIGETM